MFLEGLKPAAAAGALAVLASAAGADAPSGYAFDKPRILAEQLVWGRAHGVRLLAHACRERGDDDASAAYLAWLETQSWRIAEAAAALARHYFGRDAAPPDAINAALRLKPRLDVDSAELAEACATLPEALAAPRYDLERYFREQLKQ